MIKFANLHGNLKVRQPNRHLLYQPLLADADRLLNNGDISTGVLTVLEATLLAQPDVPRNLVFVTTDGDDSITGGSYVISGYDEEGKPATETVVMPASATTHTATGVQPWSHVTQIVITAAGAAAADTVDIGTGEALGLPFPITSIGQVIAVMTLPAGVNDLAAGGVLNVANQTYTPFDTANDDQSYLFEIAC